MLHEYHVIYSVRYYPRFHITAVGLGTYYPGYGGTPAYQVHVTCGFERARLTAFFLRCTATPSHMHLSVGQQVTDHRDTEELGIQAAHRVVNSWTDGKKRKPVTMLSKVRRQEGM
jgi:hypothetical protein